jgi:hypothetical protein
VDETTTEKEKQIPCGNDNKKGKSKDEGGGLVEVEVEKRISPLRRSQMRERLRSKMTISYSGRTVKVEKQKADPPASRKDDN